MDGLPTYRPGLILSIIPGADIKKHRFITYAGVHTGAGALAAGVNMFESDATDDRTSAIATGTAVVLAKAPISIGTPIASDANGCAVGAIAGNYVVGIALTEGKVDSYMEVELVKFKI